MKITLRNIGASGAVKAVESTGQLAHIRVGLGRSAVEDRIEDATNLTLEFADRATLERVLMDVLYAYGSPAFSVGEWRDIAGLLDYAASQGVTDDLKERAKHYARQINDAYGVKP